VAKASLTFCALQFSSTDFARLARRISCLIALHFSYTRRRLSRWLAHRITRRIARKTFLTIVDGFRGGSLVGLLVGLIVTFLTLVDGFRGCSLIGLLVGLHVTFLTLVGGFHGSSLLGFLVGLCVTFLTLVDGFAGLSLVRMLVGLLVGVRVYFFYTRR